MSKVLGIDALAGIRDWVKSEDDAVKAELRTYVGSPLVASTVAGMTDQTKVYVYTGSETGYTAGNWYYYNGSAWTSGGVYNSTALETDTTLTIAGMAADAKATGDEITHVKQDINELEIQVPVASIKNHLERATFSGTYFDPSTTRVAMTKKTRFDGELTITPESGYKYNLQYWLDENTLHSQSGWKTTPVTLDGSTYLFTWTMANTSDTTCDVDIIEHFDIKFIPDAIIEEQNKIKEYASEGIYAFLTNAQTCEYDVETGKLNIKNASITVKHNGGNYVFSQSDISTLFGNKVTITGGNLYLAVGQANALMFNLETKSLEIVSNIYLGQYKKVCLFASHYVAGNIGALVESSNDLKLKALIDNPVSLTDPRLFNGSPMYELPANAETKMQEFTALFNNTEGRVDSFLFFTDPHIFADVSTTDYAKFRAMLSTFEHIYNSMPCDYIMCGGDWWTDAVSKVNACYILGYIDGVTRTMYKNYHNIVGNHDTNHYDGGGQYGSLALDTVVIRNLWNRAGNLYYSFDSATAKNFVFDTGRTDLPNMDAYRWEQIAWFADELLNHEKPHMTVNIHAGYIDTYQGTDRYYTFATIISQMIAAYNGRTTITQNGVTYDFSNCTGKIHYILGGHVHQDILKTFGGVPYIMRADAKNGNVFTCDLVLADYVAETLTFKRIGTGSDLVVNI